MEAALGRPLQPVVQDSSAPLSEGDLQFMVGQAEDLFWNELEWENITAEEQIPGGMFTEQAFPGFLALVRGLLLAEVMPDALAEAAPRPTVVHAILAFLLQELDRFRERLENEPDDAERIKTEIAMTEALVDLVLATLFGLAAEDMDRLAEARGRG
jgi:hypothetical protein